MNIEHMSTAQLEDLLVRIEDELDRREYDSEMYPHDEHAGLDLPGGYSS